MSKQALGSGFVTAPTIFGIVRSRLPLRSLELSRNFKRGRWNMCSDIDEVTKAAIFKASPFHEYRVARSRRLSSKPSEVSKLMSETSSEKDPPVQTDSTMRSPRQHTEPSKKKKARNGAVKKVRTRKRVADEDVNSLDLEEVEVKDTSIDHEVRFASHGDLIRALLGMQNDPLQGEGGRIVTYRGSNTAKLMIIGEAPGEMEDKLGRPFVGRAGELLDKIFEYGGFDTETQIYVTNVVKRRPHKNRTPNTAEMQYYKPYLLEEIRLIRPAIIVLAGAVAAQAMLGPVSITKVRGKWYGGGTEPWMMPVFHPAYLLRNPIRKHDMVTDIEEIRHKYMQVVPYDTLSPLK